MVEQGVATRTLVLRWLPETTDVGGTSLVEGHGHGHHLQISGDGSQALSLQSATKVPKTGGLQERAGVPLIFHSRGMSVWSWLTLRISKHVSMATAGGKQPHLFSLEGAGRRNWQTPALEDPAGPWALSPRHPRLSRQQNKPWVSKHIPHGTREWEH